MTSFGISKNILHQNIFSHRQRRVGSRHTSRRVELIPKLDRPFGRLRWLERTRGTHGDADGDMIGKKVSDLMMPSATDSKQERELGELTLCCSTDHLIVDSENYLVWDLSVDLLDQFCRFWQAKTAHRCFQCCDQRP